MIKLKDELANSRVEILRSRAFREPIDIAEMHWNDTKKSILELIGVVRAGGDQSAQEAATPMDIDPELIDIIGPERARQLYPQLFKNKPNGSSFSQRRSNLNLSGEFPIRDSPQKSVKDLSLETAGLKTALVLAEEKNKSYEQKVEKLEQELKKVYEQTIKLSEQKKVLEKKVQTLNTQLDKVTNKGQTYCMSNTDNEDDIQVLRTVKRPTNSAFDYIRKQKRRALVFTNSKYAANTRRYTDRLMASRNRVGLKSNDANDANNNGTNQGMGTSVRRPLPMRKMPIGPDFQEDKLSQFNQLRQLSNQSRPTQFKPKPSPRAYKSVSFNQNPDERLIRDLTFPTARTQRIQPTSVPQPSIVDHNVGTRRLPPGILPMPSYRIGNQGYSSGQSYSGTQGYGETQGYSGSRAYGGRQSYGGGQGYQGQGYGYSDRFNQSAYF